MVGLFFRNLFHSLLQVLFVAIISFLATMLIFAIATQILRFPFPQSALCITDIIFSVIVALLWLSRKSFEYKSAKQPSRPVWAILGLILVFLLIGVTCGAICYILYGHIGYDNLIALKVDITATGEALKNIAVEDMIYVIFITYLPFILIPAAITEFFYLVIVCYRYRQREICKGCRHIFCIDYVVSSVSSWDSESTHTSTSREKVGTVESEGQKVDVYSDVSRTKVTKWRNETTHFVGTCRLCGHRTEYSVTKSRIKN